MDLGATLHINRPAGVVFSYLSDASNNTTWQRGMQSCTWTSVGPIGIGATYDQVARFMGRTIRTSFEVTEFLPGRAITITSTASTFPITVRRSVEPVDATACSVTAEIGGGPKLPSFLEGFAGRMAQRSVDRDYSRLKELMESG